MPSREYTDLEETKPSYMVDGTENKHTVTILENCLQELLKPNIYMPRNFTPRCIPKKSADIPYTHQRPV